jgi:glycosyltransferase involved in cell wall biosynthesis
MLSSSQISEGLASAHLPGAAEPVDVTVVMPCLNERRTVGVCVQKAISTMERLGIRGEVLVADNGSTDDSQRIAEAMGARVIEVKTRGYGSALLAGIAAARGSLVVVGDSDDSYDFTQIGDFVDKLNEGYDLVIGNRFAGSIRPGAMPPLHRYLGNPALTWFARLLYSCPIGDSQCGLRALRKSAVEKLNLQMLGMEFASEMIVKATLFDLRIAEVPTTLSPDGRDRRPHLRTWRDGWRHLRFLLLYSPRWLFLYPGVLLMLLGFAASLWLLRGPRTIGRVEFDVDTLLFGAMAILIGFQSINFSVFSKIFAIMEGLLPADEKLTRAFRYVTLETGLAAGSFLMLSGAALWAIGFTYWHSHNFGPLDPGRTLRIVIPGLVSCTLGLQVILSSFFLSLLGMVRR